MDGKITIQSLSKEKGDLCHKIISIRIREELLKKIEDISSNTNRSRNEIINLLLESAVNMVSIEE